MFVLLQVDSNETRYLVGSVLSEGSAAVNEDMLKKFTDNDFKIMHLPEVRCFQVVYFLVP